MRKFMQKSVRTGVSVLFILALLLTVGCEKSVTGPKGDELKVSKATHDGLVSGWQTIHSLDAVSRVSKMVGSNTGVEEPEYGGITSKKKLNMEVRKMKKGIAEALSSNRPNGINDGDSLLWFIDWTDPISGVSVRKAFYYNNTTGKARYYETIYKFPSQLELKYDSTEIRADLNFTLNDTTDDKVLSLYKLSEFKPAFYVNKIEANAQVTDWDEQNQVTGVILNNEVWYGQQNELEKLNQELEINPDESGHAHERLDYRDGTFKESNINFYPDYTGDFSGVWRDGTTVNGTFDRLEDDNHANVTQTITFPSGNDPRQIDQMADVTIDPADSSTSVILKEKIYFVNGTVDTSQVNVDEYFENTRKHTHLQSWKSDGSHGDLLVVQYDSYKTIDGNYTGPQGYFTLISATIYNDGSGDMTLKIYQSEEAYNNGEPPLVVITIHFNPDGSGEGQITEGDQTYRVKVRQNGQMVVNDEKGNRETVNGF